MIRTLALNTAARMKAVVYKEPFKVAVEDVSRPKIQNPNDAIVRITTAAICGSDLHMYEGVDRGVDAVGYQAAAGGKEVPNTVLMSLVKVVRATGA